MLASPPSKVRHRTGSTARKQSMLRIETDPQHHLAGPFLPQTPVGDMGWYESPTSPIAARRKGQATSKNDLWSDIMTLRWAVEPSSSFKLLLIPVVLYVSWELLASYIAQDLPNPFAPLMFISHHIATSPTSDPRYAKGYLDLLFLAYYIVTVTIFRRIGKYFGLRKRAKLDRYGEQGYAMVYFGVMSLWGIRIMSQHPTWWFNTEYYWINYPHWDMQPELKCYYLMQASHWIQELLVLVMGLEKPRKDYAELVAHHIVTIWLIGWSYLANMTLIGNAVYLSMDLPDSFLAFSKLLNYMRYDRAKSVSFAMLVVLWTYFRHWKNLVILWSVWFQFDLMPDQSKQWLPEAGVWMVWWMKYQIFFPIFMLQLLNCFWYFLILRILIRSFTAELDDSRSDDEGDGGETGDEHEKKVQPKK
ncbi:longevity assurance proteins LAG1/LAC1 [Athelia psychrophila]|uniref:Longevity assurance proteins LAG1/LAC1 n=1 Tax=Athelia psychrophila TaxID=1759441 RepID=A0A167WK04_9AGAM|nr:longevity assurance proteins LAG1/LAC1 [Fibularhizoctonia sp. CBS 109695]